MSLSLYLSHQKIRLKIKLNFISLEKKCVFGCCNLVTLKLSQTIDGISTALDAAVACIPHCISNVKNKHTDQTVV